MSQYPPRSSAAGGGGGYNASSSSHGHSPTSPMYAGDGGGGLHRGHTFGHTFGASSNPSSPPTNSNFDYAYGVSSASNGHFPHRVHEEPAELEHLDERPQRGYVLRDGPPSSYTYTEPTSDMRRSASSGSQGYSAPSHPPRADDPYAFSAGNGQRIPAQRQNSAASKLEPRRQDFGPEYPEGWTQEDMEAEKEFLRQGMFNWRDMKDWRFWIRKEWWYWYLALVIISVLVILMTVYHDQIVEWCEPAANWMKDLPGGWAIPIGILFIISFPPLFGHEIVAIICGLVWGLWIGFGIVSAGTFLGEIGNFYAFKYCCRSRAEKYERKNIMYACLAYTMREGSLWIIIAARLSAIPGHLTTAVFATCGMNIWVFMLGAFLTLPKQLVAVYLGVIFKGDKKSTTNTIISYTVLVVGVLITFGAAWWIWWEMHKVRVIVWRKRRMEMASRGISLGEIGYDEREKLRPSGDLEAARPILSSSPVPGHAGHDHNPYPPRHLAHSPAHNAQYPPAPLHTSAGIRDLAARSNNPDMRASYQTPYEMRYHRADDMSVYNVDAFTERLNLEADMVDRSSPSNTGRHRAEAGSGAGAWSPMRDPESNPYASFPAQTSSGPNFPAAQASGLRREPSAASAFYRPGEERPQVMQSSFPSASPYPGGRI